MATTDTALAGRTPGEVLSLIVCRNSQGAEVRGTLHTLNRYSAIFEVYNPYSILQLSEVLTDFRIIINDRVLYSGRAVITNLVNTGILLILEASLSEDGWIDVEVFSPVHLRERLQAEFADFLRETQRIHQVIPEFKVVVSDMHILLSDLRHWMEQVELGVRSLPSGDRIEAEREAFSLMEEPLLPAVEPLLERLEATSKAIAVEQQPVHRSYIKRQIHPLILCSPFTYRTYYKPLGYAGDYEMVSMMLRNPYEGSTMFAKVLNKIFLETAPVVAHRNRIVYLTERLTEETGRVAEQGRSARFFNLGCGPAQEIQHFMLRHPLSDNAEFLLLDFNDETLEHAAGVLQEVRHSSGRETKIEFVKRSRFIILRHPT